MVGLDLRSWEVAFCGAEPIRAATLAAFQAKLGPVGLSPRALHPCYGLAEATHMVTAAGYATPPVTRKVDAESLAKNVARPATERPARVLVGCGAVIDGTEVRVVDPGTLGACAEGEIGEIWVAGPGVALGYWGRKGESQETFGACLSSGEGPYLRTGDLGYLDHGELFVTGRRKDVIIVKGRNYYPQDIEHSVSASDPGLRADGAVWPSRSTRVTRSLSSSSRKWMPRRCVGDLEQGYSAHREGGLRVLRDRASRDRAGAEGRRGPNLERQAAAPAHKQRYLARDLEVLWRGNGSP